MVSTVGAVIRDVRAVLRDVIDFLYRISVRSPFSSKHGAGAPLFQLFS